MKDIDIARKYMSKFGFAKDSGIHFDLSFTSFKNMCRAKRCQLTGILLTDKSGQCLKATDRTIDRIDSNKGYIKGNCMVVCHGANEFKSRFENGKNLIKTNHAMKILRFMEKNELS